MIDIRLSPEPIDIGALLTGIDRAGVGAVASFTGIVRADDGVEALFLDHYPGATERALREIADQAAKRWSLAHVLIAHRVGRMMPGDMVVLVAAAAAHRHPALEACAAIIDRLKTEAPFWKRETVAGVDRWVEPRGADMAAAARWAGTA